jgi:chromosome segregation ATPase
MRTAQERAGGEKGRLQEAIERHRAALKELVARAEEILRDTGRSPTGDTIDRVWETLRAASLDPDFQDDLVSGRLGHELESSGFPAGLTIQASRSPRRAKGDGDGTQGPQRQAMREARDELKRLEREVEKSRKRVRRLEAREKRAQEALQHAVEEADEARAELAQAEESLADARERADRLG